MIRSLMTHLLLFMALLLCAASLAEAQGSGYKEYRRSTDKQEYFEIIFDQRYIEIAIPGEGNGWKRIPQDQVKTGKEQVSAREDLLFDAGNLLVGTQTLPVDNIYDTRIDEHEKSVLLTFYSRSDDSQRSSQIRRGNLIAPHEKIVVQEEEFIRGLVFTVTEDIEIFGEVNKDVISLFGNVYIGPDAVVRGDIASITGRVDVSRDASVYGEVFTGKQRSGRRYRHWHRTDRVHIISDFAYNRVDGFMSQLGLKYIDIDSLLPTVWASVGRAFASERWRFDVGMEQTILRQPAFAVGGSYYRRLASDDDWLLSDCQNLFYTLLVTEDFKDYYEAEGGTAYLKLSPLRHITLETRYRREDTKWLDAHPRLFSLFGGDKLFSPNFGAVDPSFRARGAAEIDTTTISSLSARATFDSRDRNHPLRISAWVVRGEIEWSHPDIDSDFDFSRYTFDLHRYQKLGRRIMLILGGRYGNSDGYLPMHRRFYLGGLGTLRGYKHKEFTGTEFWMSNIEYRVDFPRTDLAISMFWGGAQIANETKLDNSVELKQSLGMALYLGDGFRVSLVKRLDRSHDDDPKFYVRFSHWL